MPDLSVYCADCSERSRSELQAAIDREPDMCWAGGCGEGNCAMEEIARLAPDVVIHTMELPGLDGFALIERICSLPLPPVIIVTSHITQEFCIEECMRLGAAYYLVKPLPARLIVQRIRDVFRLCRRFGKESPPSSPSSVCCCEEKLRAILLQLGVRPSLKGYGYALAGALVSLHRQSTSLACCIYPEIARRYGVTASCIERDIRHAISTAWMQPESELRRRLFSDARPGNRRFIQQLAREIERGLP